MEWLQVLFLFLANGSLIIWFRAESRNDWRRMDNKTDAIRHEVAAIHLEIKDFHQRLCDIESRKNTPKECGDG